MIRLLTILLLLLPLRSFATEISDLYVDEATQKLIIVGHFGNVEGGVTVDGVTLPVLSWTDTLIECHIDSAGRGSCGPVVVLDFSLNRSNTVLLTEVRFTLQYKFEQYDIRQNIHELCTWHLRYRLVSNFKRNLLPSRSSVVTFEFREQDNPYDLANCDRCARILEGSGSLSPNYADHSGFGLTTYYDVGAFEFTLESLSEDSAITSRVIHYDLSEDVTHGPFYLLRFLFRGDFSVGLNREFSIADSSIDADPGDGKRVELMNWRHDTTLFAPAISSVVLKPRTQARLALGGSRAVTIPVDDASSQIDVLDVTGRTVVSMVCSGSARLQVLPGFYLVRIESNTATKVIPVVVW